MSFKKKSKQMTFADLEVLHNPSFTNKRLKRLSEIQDSIDWEPIEKALIENYEPGCNKFGPSPYPPLMLFKCLLLQKWFRIDSDPELESQINDSIAFKRFLEIPLDKPSPDHSTFSRFRGRLSKRQLGRITQNVLNQFSQKGITINEGIAVDARIVKSASKPLSKKKLKALQEERSTPEGKLDKSGKLRKFSRDLESNWTIKNEKAYFGLKEHASIDTNHGFILATALSQASVHDTNYFQYCTIFSRHTPQKLKKVYADKGYHGRQNRGFLSMNNFGDGIMRKNSTTAKLTEYEKDRNKDISKVRYIVEQYFGISHLHDRGQRARFTTIAKNNIDIWLRQTAYNIGKGIKALAKMDQKEVLQR